MPNSSLRLSADIQVEATEIESATLDKKGAKLTGKAITVGSGAEDLRVPEDVLIVRLKDGSQLAVRGSDAQSAYQLLSQAAKQQTGAFKLTTNQPE